MSQPEENREKSTKTDDVLLRPAGRDPHVDRMPPPPAGEGVLTEPAGELTRRATNDPTNSTEPPD